MLIGSWQVACWLVTFVILQVVGGRWQVAGGSGKVVGSRWQVAGGPTVWGSIGPQLRVGVGGGKL